MMKKLISGVLSLALVMGATRTSFADEIPQIETNFTIKTNFPTQQTTKIPELTEKERQELKAEKQAQKLEEELKEKLKDSYSDIMEENPCMKTAFQEVNALLLKPDYDAITKKLYELNDEKEALLAYKKNILEKPDSKDKSLEKQLKNINNRLQAIEYTEKRLIFPKLRMDVEKGQKAASKFLRVLCGLIAAGVGYVLYKESHSSYCYY